MSPGLIVYSGSGTPLFLHAEQIFSIPGIGSQFVSSILTNDYQIIMGTTIVYAMMLMVVLLITDILYGLIDPRIRLAK